MSPTSLPTELYILKKIKTDEQQTQWTKWINKTNNQKSIWSSFLVDHTFWVGVLPWNRLIYTAKCHWRNWFPFLSSYQLHAIMGMGVALCPFHLLRVFIFPVLTFCRSFQGCHCLWEFSFILWHCYLYVILHLWLLQSFCHLFCIHPWTLKSYLGLSSPKYFVFL